MSRIAVIVKPMPCSARRALSRPDPGPLTSISSISIPCSRAFRPASSAATCAAYGVDLRLPLKPWLPLDDHAMVLPCASEIVIMVLLKLAATCATPAVIFFRSFLRVRAGAAAFAMFMWSFPKAVGRPVRPAQGFAGGRLLTWSPSSCRQSVPPCPCEFGRWCASSGL